MRDSDSSTSGGKCYTLVIDEQQRKILCAALSYFVSNNRRCASDLDGLRSKELLTSLSYGLSGATTAEMLKPGYVRVTNGLCL